MLKCSHHCSRNPRKAHTMCVCALSCSHALYTSVHITLVFSSFGLRLCLYACSCTFGMCTFLAKLLPTCILSYFTSSHLPFRIIFFLVLIESVPHSLQMLDYNVPGGMHRHDSIRNYLLSSHDLLVLNLLRSKGVEITVIGLVIGRQVEQRTLCC